MIYLDNVSKRYRLGNGEGSLRSALASLPLRLTGKRRELDSAEHWALRNVSFQVSRGEALGIVGRNGAGKTTILKLLSKITQPTTGRLGVEGRASALVELGAGFHPDLSGRENIYLYGAIMGLSRKQLDQKLNSIIDFAELAPFIETPIKRYSSGMYARLAFSVAAHVDPDVMLVDEVLSVGDNNFQQKCFDFIHRFVNSGKTTVFISHNLYAVEQLCQRLVWLHQGHVQMIGEPGRVLEQYLSFLEDASTSEPTENSDVDEATTNNKLRIPSVTLRDQTGTVKQIFSSGEDLVIDIAYETDRPLPRPHFCVWVSDTPAPNPLFAANMMLDGEAPTVINGRGTVRCVFKALPVMPRAFYVWVEVYAADRAEILFKWQRVASLRVIDRALLEGLEGQRGAVGFAKSHGPMRVPYEWQMLDAAPAELLLPRSAVEPVAS